MKNVEDIYPLSPMQELMLLRSLSQSGPNTLVDQGCYTVGGELDVARFRRSWQQVVDRHPALRTSFVWEGLKQPLQAVREQAELPFQEFDLSELSPQEQSSRLREFRETDRAQGFTLSRAPLLRISLFRLGEEESFCICTSHHLILDRWCISIVHDELARFYAGAANELAPPTPYRSYIAWVQKRAPNSAQDFWERELRGLAAPTSMVTGAREHLQSPGEQYDESSLQLSEELTGRLRQFASRNHVTLATAAQAAWALTLNHFTQQTDVVFGLTVSGRPLDLIGVESIVGSFINNLPIRIRLKLGESLVGLVQSVHELQQSMRPYEYVSASEVHRWSDLSPADALFDSLLVWADKVADPRPGERLTMQAVPGPIRTATPMTAVFVDGETIDIQISCFRGFSYRASSPQICKVLHEKLQLLLDQPTGLIGALVPKEGEKTPRTEEVPLSQASMTQRAALERTNDCQAGQDPDFELQALRQQLCVEWERALGFPIEDMQASFFELGGTSFQAAHLHGRVQAITRKNVSLIHLFLKPTVVEMANLLRQADLPVCQGIVSAIQPKGNRPPLFCIATPESNPIGYAALARYLGDNQPLYLVQSAPSTELPQRLSPDELAECVSPYLEAIRDTYEPGPYCLVGMCWGAYLAFDIARELAEAGRPVGLLGILDTWAKYTLAPPTYASWLSGRRRYYADRLRSYWQLPPKERFSQIGDAVGRKVRRLQEKLAALTSSGTNVNPWDEHVRVASDVDLSQQRYDGRVTVFRRPIQPKQRVGDKELGWSQFADVVDVRMLACEEEDYTAILREPYVRDVALRIEEALGHAQK